MKAPRVAPSLNLPLSPQCLLIQLHAQPDRMALSLKVLGFKKGDKFRV